MEVLTYEEVKVVGGDRAYDSDAIRAMIAAAGNLKWIVNTP